VNGSEGGRVDGSDGSDGRVDGLRAAGWTGLRAAGWTSLHRSINVRRAMSSPSRPILASIQIRERY